MKVLHLIDHIGPGGAQTIVKGIVERQKDNQNVFLFALRRNKESFEIEHQNVLISISDKRFSLAPLLELKKVIKKERIEILHCHLLRAQILGFLLKEIWFRKIKLVFHEHGGILQRKWYSLLFLKAAKSQVNLFMAVSKTVKKELIRIGIDREKITTLFNFIELKRFNKNNIDEIELTRIRNELGLKKEVFLIGYIGRLGREKGVEHLIKSSAFLIFPFKVLIIGKGKEENQLKKLVKKLKLETRVKFLGFQEEIEKYYPLLDVLIMPSLSEAFGLCALEAQAMGIPVIASRVGGLTEIIFDNENGLLFESKDSQSLASKIALIYQDKGLREKLIKNGLIGARDYSFKGYLDCLKEIYQNL